MKKIVIDNQEVFFKKDFFGWRVVEPIIHPNTKKFIWKNFLNKKGFILLGFILLLLAIFYLAFNEQVSNYQQVLNNPCSYCKDCQQHVLDTINSMVSEDKPTFNLTNIKLSK